MLGAKVGIDSFSSVAWGEGTSKGVVRSPDKMRSRFKAWGLRDNDHQIIPPIALKATKIPIKSSKPKDVLSEDEGSGGKEFVILTAKEYSQIKPLTRAFAIPLLGRFFYSTRNKLATLLIAGKARISAKEALKSPSRTS